MYVYNRIKNNENKCDVYISDYCSYKLKIFKIYIVKIR